MGTGWQNLGICLTGVPYVGRRGCCQGAWNRSRNSKQEEEGGVKQFGEIPAFV